MQLVKQHFSDALRQVLNGGFHDAAVMAEHHLKVIDGLDLDATQAHAVFKNEFQDLPAHETLPCLGDRGAEGETNVAAGVAQSLDFIPETTVDCLLLTQLRQQRSDLPTHGDLAFDLIGITDDGIGICPRLQQLMVEFVQ